MYQNFLKIKKKSETDNDVKLTPMNTSKTWAIENFFIEVYSLLAHRIQGLGWSLKEFYQIDTWTTSKLYCMEVELIEEEDRKLNNKSNPEQFNDPEVEDLVEEMFD